MSVVKEKVLSTLQEIVKLYWKYSDKFESLKTRYFFWGSFSFFFTN